VHLLCFLLCWRSENKKLVRAAQRPAEWFWISIEDIYYICMASHGLRLSVQKKNAITSIMTHMHTLTQRRRSGAQHRGRWCMLQWCWIAFNFLFTHSWKETYFGVHAVRWFWGEVLGTLLLVYYFFSSSHLTNKHTLWVLRQDRQKLQIWWNIQQSHSFIILLSCRHRKKIDP